MKVNVCLTEQDAINGYSNISINQLNSLINGSIDEIVFRHIDGLPYEDRIKIVGTLLSKMKFNGLLTLEMLDVLSIGKEMFNGNITAKALSSLVTHINSVGYESDILDQLANFPKYIIRNKYSHNHKLTLIVMKKQ